MSEEHIATSRLLLSEGEKAPDLVNSFNEVGPQSMQLMLTDFFSKRLNIAESQSIQRLWIGMLLSQRTEVLTG